LQNSYILIAFVVSFKTGTKITRTCNSANASIFETCIQRAVRTVAMSSKNKPNETKSTKLSNIVVATIVAPQIVAPHMS